MPPSESQGQDPSTDLKLEDRWSRLRRKEDLLRLLVESVEDYAIFALDLEGRVSSWNPGAERTKGWTEEEILGEHFSVFYPPEDVRAGKPEHGLRVAAAEGRFENQGWRIRRDGSPFWANVVISPLRDDSGQLIGFAKVTRDLTERMRAEERARDLLREQTAREAAEAAQVRISAILESISDGFFSVNRGGRFLYVNRRAEEILRRSREDLLGGSVWEKLSGVVGPAALDTCRQVAGERQPAEFEHFCPPLEIWLQVHVYPSEEGFSVYFHDITAQKRAEEALREGERRLREVIDLLPVGVFLTDAHGRIEWHNPAGRSIWGGSRFVGIEGYDEYKGWWPETGRRVRPEEWAVVRALQGEAVSGQVIDIEAFDGTRKTIFNSAFALRGASSEVEAVAILNEDITERKWEAAALRGREEWLGIISHELRSPLHAILLQLGALRLARPEGMEAGGLDRLEAIEHSASQMARLLEDLVDHTRMGTGRLRIRRSREDASSIIQEALGIMEPLSRSAGVRLESDVAEPLPALSADRQRILQVLTNLVENAVKHTPRGGTITVRVDALREEVRFCVADTGPGIPREHLPHLFERFWQAPQAGRGAGLGLPIAKGIVESHGGRIWVESTPQGSTFCFTLPLADAAAAEDRASASPAGSRGYRLHAVDAAAPEGARTEADRPRFADMAGASERRARLLAELRRRAGSELCESPELAGALYESIAALVHLGELLPGDRLPSIRELAQAAGVSNHTAVQAYAALRLSGLVESRDRSGTFVASGEEPGDEELGETGAWLASVLSDAWRHRIKGPYLPEVVRRYTASRVIRCACIDSDPDCLLEFCMEVEQDFGMDSHAVLLGELPPLSPGSAVEVEHLPNAVRKADLLVTTAFCLPQVRAVADALGVPVVLVSMNPEHRAAAEQRARDGHLTVVCVDPAFAERIRSVHGGRYADRIQTVLADDADAVAQLDASEPVLLTRAAHERLRRSDLRMIVPFSPWISYPCAQELARLVVRLNLEVPGA